MGERKVLNKYIPPDFDPAKVPRGKAPKGGQIKVRIMLPMTICCNTCGEFICKGTKFNARKEDVKGEDYLGMRIFRFYFRCTRCAAELAMKTDPKNGDYIVEAGASRNYEMWKDTTEEDEARAREEDEENNEMRRLENRTEESKREMDIMAALDEMRSLKARHAGVSTSEALAAVHSKRREAELRYDASTSLTSATLRDEHGRRLTTHIFSRFFRDDRAEDEELEAVKSLVKEQREALFNRTIQSESDDASDDDGDGGKGKKQPADAPAVSVVVKRPAAALAGKVTVKRKTVAPTEPEEAPPEGLGGLLGGYGTDSQSD